MAEIELVIKINKDMLDWVNNPNKFDNEYGLSDFIDLVRDGTPLPEPHGELIERDKVLKSLVNYVDGKKSLGQCIDDVPTIIEATEESE